MQLLNEDSIIDTLVQLNEHTEVLQKAVDKQRRLVSELISYINNEMEDIGPAPEPDIHAPINYTNEQIRTADKAFSEPIDDEKTIEEYKDELRYMLAITKDAFDAITRR